MASGMGSWPCWSRSSEASEEGGCGGVVRQVQVRWARDGGEVGVALVRSEPGLLQGSRPGSGPGQALRQAQGRSSGGRRDDRDVSTLAGQCAQFWPDVSAFWPNVFSLAGEVFSFRRCASPLMAPSAGSGQGSFDRLRTGASGDAGMAGMCPPWRANVSSFWPDVSSFWPECVQLFGRMCPLWRGRCPVVEGGRWLGIGHGRKARILRRQAQDRLRAGPFRGLWAGSQRTLRTGDCG